MRLFDSHVHLDSEQYDEDRAEVIARAQAAGVEGFVCVGAVDGFLSAGRALKLAEQYACVWASVGIHPNDAEEPFDIKRLRELASHPRVVAVGETGFDFYWKRASRESQERWFRAQIELALELDLPVIIHSREAAADCYAVLCDYQSDSKLRGVFHCFSEDAEFAHKLEEIRFIVSVTGNITFKNAHALRDAVGEIPLTRIMLETDGPYMAPQAFRGKRCESSHMLESAKLIAQLKSVSVAEVADITTNNALKFYGVSSNSDTASGGEL